TALLQAEGLARPSPSTAQAIFESTRGNPLFIKGLLSGVLRDTAAELIRVSERPLPPDLAAVVAEQIEAADPAVLHLLRRAAILGSRFPLALLAQLVTRDLEAVVDELLRWPELVRLEADTGEIAHPLIRHELLSRMPEQLRSRLHAEAAEAIKAT